MASEAPRQRPRDLLARRIVRKKSEVNAGGGRGKECGAGDAQTDDTGSEQKMQQI